MKFSSTKYLIGQGIKNVWVNRVMSFASFCILMVSLLLVGFSLLFSANINMFIGSIENKNEVVIFLEDGATQQQIDTMGIQLKDMTNVSHVVFYSKEQAYEDMKAKMENADEIFKSIGDESPLIDAYKIRVNDISLMNTTTAQINKLDAVYEVNSPTDFANILTGVKSTIAILSMAIIIALGVVSMVIISNSTRASVFSRRKEINIMKYVGATNAFIRIPFFVEGMFTGLLAGAAATGLTWFVYNELVKVLSQQMDLWYALGIKEFIPFDTVFTKVIMGYMAAGACLGAIGSVFSTRKHLKV